MSVPINLYHNNTEFTYFDSNGVRHTYFGKINGANCGFVINSHKAEMNFTRKLIEPKGKYITQGKWECAPASLAMLLDVSLDLVLEALIDCGWENTEFGTTMDQLNLATKKILNKELIFSYDCRFETRSILTLPSLNVIGKSHAVFWDGKEILDPNFGFEGRKHYSPSWTVDTILKYNRIILKS